MAEPREENEGGRPAGGGGNVFTRKVGPAPLWVWMLAGLGLALGYVAWRGNKQKQAAATTQDQTTTDQTPPFIIQNYTTVPPEQPGPPGPAGPPGATGGTGPVAPPAKPPVGHPTPKPGPGKGKGSHKPLAYRVKPGDTLTSIAEREHVAGGWQQLYAFNTSPQSGHTPQAIATIKKRGPNSLVTNELIYIPQ